MMSQRDMVLADNQFSRAAPLEYEGKNHKKLSANSLKFVLLHLFQLEFKQRIFEGVCVSMCVNREIVHPMRTDSLLSAWVTPWSPVTLHSTLPLHAVFYSSDNETTCVTERHGGPAL